MHRTLLTAALVGALLASLVACGGDEEKRHDGDVHDSSSTLDIGDPTGMACDPASATPQPCGTSCGDWVADCEYYCRRPDQTCQRNPCYQTYDMGGCSTDANGNPIWESGCNPWCDDDVADASDTTETDASDTHAEDVVDTTVEDTADGDTTPPPARGTCGQDSDCTDGACVAIPDTATGWHTCATPRTDVVTGCEGMMEGCCASTECTDGANGGCFLGPLWYCGGAFPQPAGVCVYDGCVGADDCTEQAGKVGLCLPAGAFNEHRARCVYGDCAADTDCAARAGGACMPFFEPCRHRLSGFFCTYDDSECRIDADCQSGLGDYCAPGADGATSCETWMPPP